MSNEPAVIIGAIEGLVIAILALVSFLAGWDETTTALVMGVLGAGIAVASSFLVRSKVTPVDQP